MKNYVTDASLKGRFPEINSYLWNSQSDYSLQKSDAEEFVTNDLDARGFDIRKLQIPLNLRAANPITANETGTQIEDEVTRQRFYYNVTAVSGAATLTLQGKQAEGDSWETVMTITITDGVTGEASVFFSNVYRYYRLNTTVTTSIDYYAYLVENIYTLLFKQKQLEYIINDNNKNGVMTDQLVQIREEYKDTMNRAKIRYDANDDRVVTNSEELSNNEIRISV